MKFVLFLVTLCIGFGAEVRAQIDNPDEPDCRIWYDYDAAGQRVKRYYQCKDYGGEHQPPDITIKATLFPNPTDGPIIVVTDVTVDELAVNIFNVQGILVTNGNCLDCSDISFNIANQLTGTYMVQIVATKQNYTTLNESHAVIKHD